MIYRGVSAITFATNASCIYSAGADGMVCEIDSLTGNLLGKFKASAKSISYMAVSSGRCFCQLGALLVIYILKSFYLNSLSLMMVFVLPGIYA